MKNILSAKTVLLFGMLAMAVVLGGQVCVLHGQSDPQSSLSRSMEQAIRLYHEGKDNDAMDRFMDILVKGTPSEKSLANEYISKITLRMNSGVQTMKDQGTEGDTLNEVGENRQVPAKKIPAAGTDLTPSEEEAADIANDQSQRERVSNKIAERIAEMRRNILVELNKSSAVKIYMGESMPKAITINPDYFFANETVFKPNAAPVLANLAGLIFTLGKANCLILPEGTVESDVKIKSIRRAIALNSYLISRGLSQSRIDINLTGEEMRFPKELTSINGMVIIFNYEKEPKLKQIEDIKSKGPKVSLGIYPTAISVDNNEGALVEFSVFESPAGKPSWKFEIFEVQPDNSILRLRKIDGYGPQYTQSYWNGRKNFFGAAYPAGKYMFSITASDLEGKETNVRKLLVIKPGPEEEKAMRARQAAMKRAQGTDLTPASSIVKKLPLKAKKSKAQERIKAKRPRKNAAPKPEEPPPATEAKDAPENRQVSYKIYFKEGTAEITPESEKKLSQVAENMTYYPMARAKLVGYAYSGEANAQGMAENRVNYVAARLANKHKIGKERLDIDAQIADTPKTVVEVKLVGEE